MQKLVLDFRFPGKIPNKYALLFNQIAGEIREPFQNLIEEISQPLEKNIDWWVESPASRNIFISPLFHYCCCLALLNRLIENKQEVPNIITDSKAFLIILTKFVQSKNISIDIRLPKITDGLSEAFSYFKKKIRPVYSLIKVLSTNFYLYHSAKRTKNLLQRSLPSEPLVLIDTFLYGSSDKERHYPGLLEYLSDKERKTVYFVPTFYQTKKIKSLHQKLRVSEVNYLLKEDFLKLSDYCFAFGHALRIFRTKISSGYFLDIDFSSLILEELFSFRGYSSAFLSLLNIRFFKRLKDTGVSIRIAINWFENQVIDKGWNAGLNQYYPDCTTIGYDGMLLTPHYLCMFPTEQEKRNYLLPQKVAVMGKGLVVSKKQFCPSLQIIVAPSFRYQGVWEERKHLPPSHSFTVLIALHVILEERNRVLCIMESLLVQDLLKSVRFLVKPHPDNSPEDIKRSFLRRWPGKFEIVTGNFNDWVEKADLLISSASSACMHTLAKGIPVIIIGNQTGLTYNPIPESFNEDIWRICYTDREILNAILFYRNRNEEEVMKHKDVGRSIRLQYFEPVNRDSVAKLLELD